jgi:stearoyl-CoA desaturase (Delta-9 desaturase)
MNKALRWFLNDDECFDHSDCINWVRLMPFMALNLSIFLIFIVHIRAIFFLFTFLVYFVQMFTITGFYHRYFSHKSFFTSKKVEVMFAVLGCLTCQNDATWWASHHRHHHRHSDSNNDEHSPITKGFFRSYMLWFFNNKNIHVKSDYVRDLLKKGHLAAIRKYCFLIILFYLCLLTLFGLLVSAYTSLHFGCIEALYYLFILPTVLSLHATYCINSVAHVCGRRRYNTADSSKNNWFLALITLGEGWHNNHHHYPVTARQGFRWYELDITYYILLFFEKIGLIWDLKKISKKKINENLI